MSNTNSGPEPWAVLTPPLSETQRSFLASHFSPPTDADLETMPEAVRKRFIDRLCSQSVLARRRLNDTEWQDENERLAKQACDGDDDAFLRLISRDARYLCSDLGLCYIATWQNALDVHDTFFARISDGRAERRSAIQAKLEQISAALLKPFSQRGKNQLPPEQDVKILYHAARAYFLGLRHMTRNIKSLAARTRRVSELRRDISGISTDEIMEDVTQPEAVGYSFLLPIQGIETLITDPKAVDSEQFDSTQIVANKPYILAKDLVTAVYDIKSRTIDKMLSGDTVVGWNLPDGRMAGFAVKPPTKFMRLWTHPTITRLLRTK